MHRAIISPAREPRFEVSPVSLLSKPSLNRANATEKSNDGSARAAQRASASPCCTSSAPPAAGDLLEGRIVVEDPAEIAGVILAVEFDEARRLHDLQQLRVDFRPV